MGILLIDTGISRAYGGEQSALIFETTLERRPSWLALPSSSSSSSSEGRVGEKEDESEGAWGKKWIETETVTALYRARRPRVLGTLKRQVAI